MAGGATSHLSLDEWAWQRKNAYTSRQAFPEVLCGSMAGGVMHIELEQSREGGEIVLVGKGCDGKQGRRYFAGVMYFGVSLVSRVNHQVLQPSAILPFHYKRASLCCLRSSRSTLISSLT